MDIYSKNFFEKTISGSISGDKNSCIYYLTAIKDATLSGKFLKCKFRYTNFSNITLENVSFWGCLFIGCKFSNIKTPPINSIKFRKCTFNLCETEAIDIQNISVRKCTFLNSKGFNQLEKINKEEVVGFKTSTNFKKTAHLICSSLEEFSCENK